MTNLLATLQANTQVWIFLLTWILAEGLFFVAIRLANRYQFCDKPDFQRKIHDAPVPTVGGVPLFLAFAAAMWISGDKVGWPFMQPILLGAGTCLLLGLLDDFRPVSAVVKLVVLFAITWAIFVYSGVKIHLFPWAWLNIIVSLVWIVGMMSAINSLDNMDGLASGITMIASAFIFFIAWEHWQRWLSFMAVSLCVGCLIFLKHNFFQPRAGIFLGDNGSYFIGFVLACMAMMGAWTDPRVDLPYAERVAKALIVPPLVLGVPIFDIVTATVLRLVNGEVRTVREAIVYCGKDHTSHRLVALGCSRREAVLLLWGLGIALGTVALLIQGSRQPALYLTMTAVTLAGLVLLAVVLNRARVYERQKTGEGAP